MARIRSIVVSSSLTPGIGSPDSSTRPGPSSRRTFSTPTFASLSITRSTCFCFGWSWMPLPPSNASISLRLFTSTRKLGAPSACITSHMIEMISPSTATDSDPAASTSNCVNCRNRPGPGLSARQTGPIAYRRNGVFSLSGYCASSRANGTVKSNRNATGSPSGLSSRNSSLFTSSPPVPSNTSRCSSAGVSSGTNPYRSNTPSIRRTTSFRTIVSSGR